jgi:hypothetical protein
MIHDIPSYSEGDVQGEVYHQLRLLDIDVRSEISLPSTEHRSSKFRADLGVYKDGRLKLLVECKHPKNTLRNKNTRQRVTYAAFETLYRIKVLWINKFEDAPKLAQATKEYLERK